MDQGVRAMQLHDVICRREAGSAIVEGIRQEWVWRSPSGFEWGYGGSGPSDLALNILLQATGDRDFSAKYHQAFKWQFVAKLPADGGVIAARDVESWIKERDPEFILEANPTGSVANGG